MFRHLLPLIAVTGVMACSPDPTAEKDGQAEPPETRITATAAADIPDAVRTAVLAARPGMVIADAEMKEREGRRYYDVEGSLNGAEIELDLLETPDGWQVVEIQRDIDWTAAPASVRAAAAAERAGFVPVRVIESAQADGSAVIYELFAEGQPATPALEVRVAGSRTEVLREAWPH